jgi:hypothetical protein
MNEGKDLIIWNIYFFFNREKFRTTHYKEKKELKSLFFTAFFNAPGRLSCSRHDVKINTGQSLSLWYSRPLLVRVWFFFLATNAFCCWCFFFTKRRKIKFNVSERTIFFLFIIRWKADENYITKKKKYYIGRKKKKI